MRLVSTLLAAALVCGLAAAQAPSGLTAAPASLRAPSPDLFRLQAEWLIAPRYRAPSAKGGAWAPAGTAVDLLMAAGGTASRGLAASDPSPGADTGYGYTWYDRNEQVALFADDFESVAGQGELHFLGDDDADLVTMGFDFGFPFYGSVYSQVVICANGYLSFTSTACLPFGTPGDSDPPNSVVAGYWTDLNQNAGGSVTTYDDVAPDGRAVFIAEWTDVPIANPFPDAETYTFQIRLYEDGEIRLVYPRNFQDQVGGAIGIENASAFNWLDIRGAYSMAGRSPNIGIDGLFVIQPPPFAGLTVGPYNPLSGLPLDFTYVTEPCGSQPSRVQEFVVLNTTGGTLTLSPSISGDPEFEILSVPGPLGPAEVGYVEVAFRGLPGSGGTPGAPAYKSASLFTGANPAEIELSGLTIETAVSPHERQAGGYDARTSVAGCNAIPAPAAALLPFGPSVLDRPLTLDFYTPDSLALATPFRLYGEPYSQVYVNSSGALTFETPDQPGRLLIDLPTPDTTAYVAPIAYGYFSFGTPSPSVPTPGFAYGGTRDVTGDGVDDLVITFYRVNTFFGGYVTWQAVLAPSDDPGANGSLRFQYFAGDDPLDGQPFASDYDAYIGINYQGLAGIAGDHGEMFHETRSLAFLAYNLFPATFDRVLESVAVELTPHAERVVSPGPGPFRAGWRMLSPPSGGMTVGSLAEQNLVQGISDSYPTDGDGNPVGANLFTAYDGATGFVVPDSLGQALIPGRGLLWYFYDLDLLPEVDTGRSQSVALPAPLVAGGPLFTPPLGAVVPVPLTTTPDANGKRWEMVGNPFATPLDVTGLAAWATGGTLGSGVGQTYDPSTRSYVLTSDRGNVLPVWEGMLVEAGTATGLNLQQTGTPTREASAHAGVAHATVGFSLAGTGADGPTLDRAAVLYVGDDADAGWDLQDASKLAVDGAHALVAFMDGDALKAQESRPAGAAFSVPMAVEAAGVEPALTLSWRGVDALPGGWSLLLTDTVTGQTVDLASASSYTFTVEPGAARAMPAGPPAPRALAAAGTAPRFRLDVTPGLVVSTGDVPAVLALTLRGANPVRGTARLSLDLPAAATVQAVVYDVTGREVARLHDGEATAGHLAFEWDTRSVAAGAYVVRVVAGREARTLKLLVVR